MIIGLTGGVACGKTITREKITALEPINFFDADKHTKEILAEASTQATLKVLFGSDAINQDESQNVEFIEESIFSDPICRVKLQELVHPKVIARCKEIIRAAKAEGKDLLLDIPLLFEVGMHKECDTIITVTCSETTQIKRLKERGIDRKLAKKIVGSQMALADKISQSQYVINNNASIKRLDSQIMKTIKSIKKTKKKSTI